MAGAHPDEAVSSTSRGPRRSAAAQPAGFMQGTSRGRGGARTCRAGHLHEPRGQLRQGRGDQLRPRVLGQLRVRRQLRRLPILDITADQPGWLSTRSATARRTMSPSTRWAASGSCSSRSTRRRRRRTARAPTRRSVTRRTSVAGYEGVRVFDVTNPAVAGVRGHDPDGVRLATHTLVPTAAARSSTSRRIRSARTSRRMAGGPGDFRVQDAAQEDLDHRGQCSGRQLRSPPARRRRSATTRRSTAASRPATTSRCSCRRSSRSHPCAATRSCGTSPIRGTRRRTSGQAHPHPQPLRGRHVRVHPLGRRLVGREDDRDHGRDGRRRDRGVRRTRPRTASTTSTTT